MAHEYAVNKHDQKEAEIIEDCLKLHLQFSKSNQEVAETGIMRCKKMVRVTKEYCLAYEKLSELLEYTHKLGFRELKAEIELLISELYLAIDEPV